MLRTGSHIFLCLIMAALITGCSGFSRLATDIAEARSQLRVVSGDMLSPDCPGCTVIIVVLGDETGQSIHNYRVFERARGPFQVAALRESRHLFAFVDRNRDFSYQPDEPAAWVDLKPRGIFSDWVKDVHIDLRAPVTNRVPDGMQNLYELRGNSLADVDVKLGEVIRLDDPRFNDESAAMGMWEPIGFMKSGRAGVFFLEPYDPRRIPVLFVHGINGSPRNFSFLIANLDRQRFQAWVLNYPSGMDLRAAGDGLLGLLADLRLRHDFGTLHIVAHSMGGLLVREFLAESRRSGTGAYLGEIITLSSPFGGIEAIDTLGVEHRELVVPAWRNLAPRGSFIQGLFDTPLPGRARHHLVFGFRNAATLSRQSGDGTIPLSSQLPQAAQAQATQIRGFDENHMTLLEAPDVARLIDDILTGRSPASR